MMKKPGLIILTTTLLLLFNVIIFITRPIKIGILFSLDSSIGNEEFLAAQYYVKQNPKIGIRKVKLFLETPILDKNHIEKSFLKLKSKGVKAIVGCALSHEGVIVAPLAEKYKIPVISPTVSTPILTDKDDYFFRFIMATEAHGKNPGFYLNSINSAKTAITISEKNRAYSEKVADSFMRSYKGEAIKIFNAVDEKKYSRLLEFNPDYVFFILPSNEVVTYLNFLKSELPETSLMTSSWGYQQLLSVYSGPLLNGLLVQTMSDKVMTPYFNDEASRFRSMYKLNPSYIFGYTISAMDQLYAAIKSTGATKSGINKYLSSPHYFNSPFGRSYMNSTGDSISQFHYIFEIRNDSLTLKKKFEIQDYPNER